jgi:hypothetical protein
MSNQPPYPPGGPHNPYAPPQSPGYRAPDAMSQDQALGYIVPVNVRNGWAVASGWLGILSLLCVGPILGIPAIITGVIALKKVPELGGAGRAWTGLILGSITTLMGLAWLVLMLTGAW